MTSCISMISTIGSLSASLVTTWAEECLKPSSDFGAIDLTLELMKQESGHGCDAILEWHAGLVMSAQSCLKNVHGVRFCWFRSPKNKRRLCFPSDSK